MANERLTESIVRDHFKEDPLYSSIKFEEQKSNNIRIVECLSEASKSRKNKPGKPEFIITFPTQSMDYLIVIECKANTEKHESTNRDKPKDYAVDGVIHYAKALSSEFNVLAIAVSGENESSLVVSNFLHKKGDENAAELPDKKLLSIYDYVKTFKNEQLNYNLKDVNIVEKAVKLNEDFHSCSISESMRNTLVSGILLALQDDIFCASYPVSANSFDLANDVLIPAIKRVLSKAKVRKLEDMMGVYAKILDEPLTKDNVIKKKKKPIQTIELFKDTIKYLEKQVFPLTKLEESGYDVLGRFYTEFVRYAASKQKQGLVLTPSHVTDLFCDLVELKVTDVVYDPCCGTGGFLIAAMKRMLMMAGNDETRKDNIRKNQLLGVEVRPEMFTFACSNMMLRGDGKSNIDRGDCFDNKTINRIKKLKPTIAFLNPPYDQGTDVQLEFIEKALESVSPQNGKVAAIVQMSCALKDDNATVAVRKRLLNKHTLKAVMSMPDDLFYPVGVVTCVMIFEANKPNKGKKTWFGYLKNDGFVKRKGKGRIDHHSKWKNIKKDFIEAYINNEQLAGLSVKKEVTANQEWCAESYMETDYSRVKDNDFIDTVLKYVSYHVSVGDFSKLQLLNQTVEPQLQLQLGNWKDFKYNKLFNITRGSSDYLQDMNIGNYAYVSASGLNNGISAYVDSYNCEGNRIVINYDGSIGDAFYHDSKFFASEKVVSVELVKQELNVYIAMFLITLIKQEKYRYNYGLKWSVNSRMLNSTIKLPVLEINGECVLDEFGDFIPDWTFMENYIKSLSYNIK